MKMVKKSIIALAVVALMVSVAQADDPSIKKDGDWPWTYKAIDLCTIPVYMDVGHYVQMKECHKRELIVKQITCPSGREFPCYSGCEEFEVRANFPAIFGGDLRNLDGMIDKKEVWWKNDDNQISGSTGGWEKLEVCVDFWKVQLWEAAGRDKKTKVADLVITVKPPDS